MPPDTENTSPAPDTLPNAAGAAGSGAKVRKGWVVWLILAAAVPQSLVAGKVLNGALNPGGMLPGIALLMMLVIGVVWLAVVWGLVALAALLRRATMRLFILVFLALPDLWCIPFLINGAIEDLQFARTHPDPDLETGVGYFEDKAARDLVVAVTACNPVMRQYGYVCDLDKVAVLAGKTDVYATGLTSDSQISLALQYGTNPDVLRILLRTGKPPDEVLQWVLYKAIDMRNLMLLRAELDAGLDPNGLWGSVDHVLFGAAYRDWAEGVAALLDAGATIDQTDTAGYTVLMRAISERHYELAALLLARGAAEDRVASYGTTMESLIAKIPPEDREKLPPAIIALADRHKSQ